MSRTFPTPFSVSAIPWGLEESGFTRKNSLIWPLTLSQEILNVSASYQFKHARPEEVAILGRLNRDLIQSSNLRVIIFSGEDQIMRYLGLGPAINLMLRGLVFRAYIESSIDKSCIQRVYIQSPRPFSLLWANNGNQIRQIYEVFRFAAPVCERDDIYPMHYNSAYNCIRIIRLFHHERRGEPLGGDGDIDMSFRAWLYRKGLQTDDDIKRLEAIGGSFATSMFMLLISLPRGKNDKTVKIPPSKGKRRAGRSLCQQKLRQVKELYEELNKGWLKETDAQQLEQQSFSDHDRPPERRQLLCDPDSDVPLDVYELEDIVAANEHDDLEKTGISVTTLRDGKLQLEVKRVVAMPTVNSEQQSGVTIKEGFGKQVIQTQFSLLSGRLYKACHRESRVYGPGLATNIHSSITLFLPGYFKEDNEQGILVQAEIAPPGERHPEAWATAAKDDDPAARLAFRVTVKAKHSETHVIYPRAIPPSTATVFRSSSLVDWLDGATCFDLAKRRRRYVNFADHLVNVPAELEFFRGGGYVLDDGTWAKSVGKKRPLPDNSIEARANKKAAK